MYTSLAQNNKNFELPAAIERSKGLKAIGKSHDDVMGSSMVIARNYARRARKFSSPPSIKVAGRFARAGPAIAFDAGSGWVNGQGDSAFFLIITGH